MRPEPSVGSASGQFGYGAAIPPSPTVGCWNTPAIEIPGNPFCRLVAQQSFDDLNNDRGCLRVGFPPFCPSGGAVADPFVTVAKRTVGPTFGRSRPRCPLHPFTGHAGLTDCQGTGEIQEKAVVSVCWIMEPTAGRNQHPRVSALGQKRCEDCPV